MSTGSADGIIFVNYTDETFTPTQSGAIATHIWECASAARDAGDAPWVISRRGTAAPFRWSKLMLLDYPREPRGPAGNFLMRLQRRTRGVPRLSQGRWARRVSEAIAEVSGPGPTIVLQNDPELACMLRSRLPSARLVLLFQNQLPSREPFRTRLSGSVDAIGAVSNFTAEWVAAHYGMPRDSVSTIYSGVDSRKIRPPAVRGEKPVIGFVGRTGIEKAPDLLLEAALILSETTVEFGVQIVGSNHWDRLEGDAFQRRLKELADRLEKRGVTVARPGHVSRADLPAWLARSSVHVVPSRWDEPFGLTTLEGMAAGNATLASRTGGSPEVVGDGGQLFERDDPHQLAELMESLVLDRASLELWSRRARARAERFTWARTYENLRKWALAA